MKQIRALVLSLLLFLWLPTTHAQDLQGPSWDMGWVLDVDPKYVVDLEEDWDLTENWSFTWPTKGRRHSTSHFLMILTNRPFSFDGPESIEVSANSNDTFTVSITGEDADTVRSFSPSSVLNSRYLARKRWEIPPCVPKKSLPISPFLGCIV